MLRLRREHGGDEWVKRFFAALKKAPKSSSETEAGAMQQCYVWLVCASLAAERDLSPVFCDEWQLPLGQNQRQILTQIDWTLADQSMTRIIERLMAAAK